jgi:olefin beta-lactone synthetase
MRAFSILSKELRKIPIKLGLSYKLIPASNELKPIIHKSDTALITFTTGSTGTPKAAKRTHGFLQEQFEALSDKIYPQPNDVDMPVLPIVLLINLGVGCASVIANFNGRKPESINEKNIIEQIQKYKVNRLVASPFFIKRLAEYLIEHKDIFISVEKIFTGGAPVFPHEARTYNRAFPNTKIEVVYGSTEAEPISSISIKDLIDTKLLEKGLNVGKPYRKTKVKIIDYVDEAISCTSEKELLQKELKGKEIGEIIVSGSHVLREYYNNEEALLRNKIFIDGDCWHRTGDSGYLDERGVLFLTGRCSTLIHTDEGIMAPFLFENHFQSLEGVSMGTVLQMQNSIVAVVELDRKGVEEEIRKKVKSSDSRIDEVFFIKKMPRDPRHFSKIDYGSLILLLRYWIK